MKNYLLIAAIASGLVLSAGVTTVSADDGLLKLSTVQLDTVSAAGKKRNKHYRAPTAKAKADATADAFGRNAKSMTYTNAYADVDLGWASSVSGSKASASGYTRCGICVAF